MKAAATKPIDSKDVLRRYDHERTLNALDRLTGLWADGSFPTGSDIRRWRREGSRRDQ